MRMLISVSIEVEISSDKWPAYLFRRKLALKDSRFCSTP